MSGLSLPPVENKSENLRIRREFTQLVGKRIREVRKEKGMSQEEVSVGARLHLSYVGNIELGRYHPTVYVLWKIAKALGVTLNDLANF